MSKLTKLTALSAILVSVLSGPALADGFQPWTDDAARKSRDIIEAPAQTNVTPYYLEHVVVKSDDNIMERDNNVADLTPWYFSQNS